ncbi:MAG: DUF262 domain-containing protein [candidate division Zixibacteria bacterium]|nr:DUF262 domain-containing protein [candidate division Zixibacteria bacterium]MDH3937406.1 DUF262 domain-containing protein [candidate division Zixibacteria bacterium]MDH4032608.1 DUF262 domain-containing protein [candidate division Zixibacteria bacterium]
MPYTSDKIATVVQNRLNTQYFLPAIQREFVWSPDRIMKLFDSIMRGYPISSFLFWELQDANRDNWDIYRFIQNFKQNGTHNEQVPTDGIPQLTLVLDGQQRLTSLLIGLKGTYTVKKKHKRKDSPDAWMKQSLYLDLIKDPRASEEDAETGLHYGFKFFENPPDNGADHHWFKVGRILDFDSEDRFYEFRNELRDSLSDDTTKGQMSVFERCLERLYRAVWKDDAISFYTESDQDYDRVLDIFVRANEGGIKLSKSDLLLSMVTFNWGGVNAREEIHGFVDRLNKGLDKKNDFDKDFIMKTCLVLSDLPVQYKVDNFTPKNLSLIRDNWDGIKSAIERAVRLINTFGVYESTLTSANALIPIAYYFYGRPNVSLMESAATDVQNRSRIQQYLLMSLLNGVFGGTSDNLLRDLREVLGKHDGKNDFPFEDISAVISKSGRNSRFDEESLARFLSIKYGLRTSFLALSLLYDNTSWGSMTFHKDHIFPKSWFTTKQMTAKGIDNAAHKGYLELRDKIGNLQLLIDTENIAKKDKDFATWIKSRDVSFKRRHLIPVDESLYSFERFPEFVEEREKLIKARLESLFPAPRKAQEVS